MVSASEPQQGSYVLDVLAYRVGPIVGPLHVHELTIAKGRTGQGQIVERAHR